MPIIHAEGLFGTSLFNPSRRVPGFMREGGRGGRGRDLYEAQRVNAELHVINCDLASAAAHLLVSAVPRIRITVSKSPFFNKS